MGRGGDNTDSGLERDPNAVLRIPGYRGFIPGAQQYVYQLLLQQLIYLSFVCDALRAHVVR